eukprot:TRINITY_DN38374_c0_g1_i1.p1 TRINITY_DN38374_c0_g1~~TRINITY_DN38374_c0_g1_i1.p1  ORF type:complete len:312 (+),score=43.06 TRINITY_DN38374_c0_g1_i1:238-1173(+)
MAVSSLRASVVSPGLLSSRQSASFFLSPPRGPSPCVSPHSSSEAVTFSPVKARCRMRSFFEASPPSLRSQLASPLLEDVSRSNLQSSIVRSEGPRYQRQLSCASALTDAASSKAEDKPGEPRARLVAQRTEEFEVQEQGRPLSEYMSLPVSQYSVLDAERIERVDDITFKCYVQSLKFLNFEVTPVLLVRVDPQPNGCCIRLLSCTLDGSPIVKEQNEKFAASMVNNVEWRRSPRSSATCLLASDTTIEVTLSIPGALSFLSVGIVEAAGSQVLSQLLRLMVPRFLKQLGKDYQAWASGDESRQPLGTGKL